MTRILALTLALLIAVTSQQMAVARAMTTDAAGKVILCTGQGVMTVMLDADGNPMEPVHICPDCALTLLAFVDTPLATQAVVIHIQILAQTPAQVWQNPFIPTIINARGPPQIG